LGELRDWEWRLGIGRWDKIFLLSADLNPGVPERVKKTFPEYFKEIYKAIKCGNTH